MSSYTKGRFIVRDIDSPSKIKKESSPKTRKVSPPKPKNEIKIMGRFKVRDISPPK